MNKQTTERERVLLCVTGLSPQVVTETLYALAVEQRWIPNRIRLMTTAEGAKRARLSLLSDEPGWFSRLCRDYQLPPIRFTVEDILILEDARGEPMDDIRTPEDNEQAADFIVEQVRELTGDPQTELHVSIAGGRKTMGFYLGYALSLFGRSQDRLSHVLVNTPFESCWDFFYPTTYSRIIQTDHNNLADTRDAKITLAEIPFVSLRHGMADDLLQGRVSFAQAVDAVSRTFSPPELSIDLQKQRVNAAGKSIKLSPSSLALLSLFARRRMMQQDPVGAPLKDVPDSEWAQRYMHEYRQIKGEMADMDATEHALQKGMDGSYFSSCKSRLHRELKKALGHAAQAYMIDDGGTRPRRYVLRVPAEAISYQ
jgi:CRISPR-associated protein (TIGR02584 family)